MKKLLLLLSIFALTVLMTMPVTGEGKKGKMKVELPPPEGKAFLHYITEVSPYQGWGFWPGHTEMKEGKSPHGAYVKIMANPIALKAVREGKDKMPPGSMIMKENFNKKKELVALTPMYRVEGYNPDGGDWYWAKMGPDGKVMAEGKIKGCIDCHARVKKRDWVFHPPE